MRDSVLNAMTVDVEDFFHVAAFESIIDPSQWKEYQPRVDFNTRRLLDLFAKHNVKSTFFVLGWVAERYPELITEIQRQGHEIAYLEERFCDSSEFEVTTWAQKHGCASGN